MRSFIIFAVAFIAVEALSFKNEWNEFKLKHGKSYDTKEEVNRFSIFQSNLLTIANHNKKYENGESTFKMAINKFADLTSEEFRAMMTNPFVWNTTLKVEQTSFDDVMDKDIPEEVDWRQKGAVTAVKNQGSCGSCWSFSVTGTVEGQYFLKKGKLLSFSEQQLVDCANGKYLSEGCNGGYMDKGLQYVADYGLMLENAYPYKAKDQFCQYKKSEVAVKISSYKSVKAGDENELKKAVATVGPISVGIDATDTFRFYDSGVMDDTTCNNEDRNHGVLAVGYGTLNGNDYWIVKNSWGTDWGQDGYILMSRNKDQCGIAYEPTYPVL